MTHNLSTCQHLKIISYSKVINENYVNFEVAEPKLNINIQNSPRLINLIWAQRPYSIFVCLQLFSPFLLICGLQRRILRKLRGGKDCIFPLFASEICGPFSKKPLLTKSQFATSPTSSSLICWQGGVQHWGRCVPAESPSLGSLVPTQRVRLEGEPLVLLAVSYKLHAGAFDDNMVLPPGASSEAAQKAEPEISTEGITSCSLF